MKTIKIIDLLNKIVNGEEIPEYVTYYDRLYQKKDTMFCCYNNIIYKLDAKIIDLDDEVEIIEEDKNIDKINWKSCASNLKELDKNIDDLINKINELIDEVNKLKEK